ncbi:MAG: hypothetical protein AMXMBFR47_14500 [Planctomycetota bacterium]
MVAERADGVAAIILAGQLTRGRSSLDSAGPRSLLTVGHARWLHLVIDQCVSAGVTSIGVCVTELPQRLAAELEPWVERVDLRVLVDGVPRGSAGCCRDAVELFDADAFVVVEGSAHPRLPVAELLAHHRRGRAALTLAVSECGDGAVHAGGVQATPVGVAVMSAECLRQVPDVGFQDLKEGLIPRALAEGRSGGTFRVERESPRIRDLETYLYSQRLLLEDTIGAGVGVFEAWGSAPRADSGVAGDWPGVEFIGPVLVGAGTRIGSGSILVGPCVIGPGCTLDEGVVVAGSVVREGCRVGSRSVVRNSLLLPGTALDSGVDRDREILLGAAAWGAVKRRSPGGSRAATRKEA